MCISVGRLCRDQGPRVLSLDLVGEKTTRIQGAKEARRKRSLNSKGIGIDEWLFGPSRFLHDKRMPLSYCLHTAKGSRASNSLRRAAWVISQDVPEVGEDEHWMWVARVLERLNEHMRRRTYRRGKAANSKKLLRTHFKIGGPCHAIGCSIHLR